MKRSAKAGYIFFCLAFAAVSFIPSAGMILRKPGGVNAEGKEIPDPPSFRNEDGKINTQWNTQTDSYISENFAFRDSLISADTFLKEKLFGESASDQIITGKEGWLYYSETSDDFINNPDISEKGIHNIVHNLELMSRYASEHGSRLLVTCAPNKSTVYPEYMPSNYMESDASGNIERLTEALKGSDVLYFDMKEFLLESKKRTDVQLYHKRDTHWNNTGALLASEAILDTLGVAHPDFSSASFVTEKTWNGDLDRMLSPGKDLKDDQNIYDIDFTYRTKGNYRGSDDLVIDTVCDSGNGSLLMFRDSFGAAVIPFLSETFEKATYLRARPNQLYSLESSQYDYVIVEIVERNIDWLQKEAPLHAAPEVSVVPEADSECTGMHNISFDNKKYVHIYGTVNIPEQDQSPLYYVSLTDGDGNTVSYEAYNCYEAKLLNEEKVKDNGYSVYIPSSSLSGVYSVSIKAELPDHVYETQAGSFSYGTD